MSEQSTEREISLVEIILAGVIAVALAEGSLDVWDFIVGVLLLMVVHAFLDEVPRRKSKRLAIAAIMGIAITLIVGSIGTYLLFGASLLTGTSVVTGSPAMIVVNGAESASGRAALILGDYVVVVIWVISTFLVNRVYFVWKQRRTSFDG